MIIDQREFYKALSEIQRVADSRHSMPILAGVQLEASEGELTLTATDLTRFLSTTIPCRGNDLSCVLDAAALYKMVKPEKGQESYDLTIALRDFDNLKYTVNVNGLQFAVYGQLVEDYPALPMCNSDAPVTGSAPKIREALNYVLPACARDESRLSQNGIKFDRGTLAATDGHRMHTVTTRYFDGLDFFLRLDAAKTLARLLKKQETFQISESVSWTHFKVGRWSLMVKNSDCSFPPYKKVIPKTHKHTVTINSGQLRKALKQMCRSKLRDCSRIDINGKFNISFVGEEEEVKTSIPCSHDFAEDFVYGVNPHYLLDALGKKGDKTLELQLIDSESGMVVRDEQRLALVMPQRL